MTEIEEKSNVVARLFAAMEARGELPSLQSSSERIAASLQNDEAYLADLTSVVLSDLSLSQKVIRRANAAMRRSFGDEIVSVSRAIRILGVNTVERFSAEIPDIAQFQSTSPRADGGRNALKRAMAAAEFARHMTRRHASQASEEAVLSTLMHLLAPTVLALYLEEDWEKVLDYLRAYPATTLDTACRETLGVTLTVIAGKLAKHFNVPEQLAACMEATLPAVGTRAESHTQWLVTVATMSAEVASMMEKKQTRHDIERFIAPFLGTLGIDGKNLDKALEEALAVTIKADAAGGRAEFFEMPENPMERLGSALAHVRSLGATLNSASLIPVVVENLGQCLNLRSGFLLVLNTKDSVYAAKVAYGDGVRDILPSLFFSAGFVEDIFHHAMSNTNPTFFLDVRADGFLHRVPEWYKTHFPTATSMIFVPVLLKERCIALFCGTWGSKPASRALLYGEAQSVKTLAQEISLSIERSIRR